MSLDSFSPFRIVCLEQPDDEGVGLVERLSGRPLDGTRHAANLDRCPQPDLGALEACRQSERRLSETPRMRMTRIERARRKLAALARLDRDAQCAWDASDAVVRERDDQFWMYRPACAARSRRDARDNRFAGAGRRVLRAGFRSSDEDCRPPSRATSSCHRGRARAATAARSRRYRPRRWNSRAGRSGNACGTHPP